MRGRPDRPRAASCRGPGASPASGGIRRVESPRAADREVRRGSTVRHRRRPRAGERRPHGRARAGPRGRGGARPRRRSARSPGAPGRARSRSSAATRGPAASSSRPPSSPAWPAPASTCWSRRRRCPTPAVAYLTAELDADLGVMLSASHNPMPDNGIKFFARGGHKLARRRRGRDRGAPRRGAGTRPTGAGVGRVAHHADAAGRLRRAPALDARRNRLDGLTRRRRRAPTAPRPASAPQALRRAGRRRSSRSTPSPTAQHQRRLRLDPPRPTCARPCVEHGADAGIAHDGDADRCLAVDAHGDVVDGDQILAILALAMRDAGSSPRTRSSPR